MSYDLFDPPVPPSVNSDAQADFKMLTASFGDGYSQRVIDGLNNTQETADLTWDNLDQPTAFTIYNYLRATGGVNCFYWQLPSETFWRKWIVKPPLKRTFVTGQVWSLTVTLSEVFDIDTDVAVGYGSLPLNVRKNAAGQPIIDVNGNYVLS